MFLNFKEGCKFDAVSLGEVLLRLDPGDERIHTGRNFRVWEGGGEYNVIKGLNKCFKLHTGVVTAFADNEIGLLLEDLIQEAGVDTSLIKWFPTDGIGKKCRNGIYFMERGFGIRRPVGCSDRANTPISMATVKDLNLKKILEKDGVKVLHTGGIYAALSMETLKTLKDTITLAKLNGTFISYDLNYRASLWSALGEEKNIVSINADIVKNVDILIGNEGEFSKCLGLETEENRNPSEDPLNIAGFEKLLYKVQEEYPNLKVITAILHTTDSASETEIAAIALASGKIYKSKHLKNIKIFDSVGAGDAFGSGFLYGLMELNDLQAAVDYGAANSAFVMTTPGDTTMARKSELEAFLSGAGANAKR